MGRESSSSSPGAFPPTRQSAVVMVGSDDPAQRARSFDVLVRAYWKPVYKHVRIRWTRTPDEAQDLTQGFFARAFEKQYFSGYEPGRARFRTYLKTCLDRYVMEAARTEGRQKRGGDAVRVSLDFDVAEEELERFGVPAADGVASYFDREWQRSLLSATVDALADACERGGKQVYFQVFRRYVLEREMPSVGSTASRRTADSPSYQAVAEQLGISVSDVTNYLAWARREFRRLALERLRELTATDDEYRAEARELLGTDP